jgi:hypothetical protein
VRQAAHIAANDLPVTVKRKNMIRSGVDKSRAYLPPRLRDRKGGCVLISCFRPLRRFQAQARMVKKLKPQERRALRGSRDARRGSAGEPGELTEWGRILVYITGTVDQELPLRNECPVAESRILPSYSGT